MQFSSVLYTSAHRAWCTVIIATVLVVLSFVVTTLMLEQMTPRSVIGLFFVWRILRER